MIDAQPVAEHRLQPLGYLYGEGNLRKQIKYLLVLVEGFLDQMNIDFGLPRGGHAVQQGYRMSHHLQEYLVIGLCLRFVQGLHAFGMRCSTRVQSADFFLVSDKKPPFLQGPYDRHGSMGDIHQFLPRHLTERGRR